MMTMHYTTAISFTHRGWYCTVKEALGGYKVKAVAMTVPFLVHFNRLAFTEADEYRQYGVYKEFKVYQLFIGWNRAKNKAIAYIDQYLGDARVD